MKINVAALGIYRARMRGRERELERERERECHGYMTIYESATCLTPTCVCVFVCEREPNQVVYVCAERPVQVRD